MKHVDIRMMKYDVWYMNTIWWWMRHYDEMLYDKVINMEIIMRYDMLRRADGMSDDEMKWHDMRCDYVDDMAWWW